MEVAAAFDRRNPCRGQCRRHGRCRRTRSPIHSRIHSRILNRPRIHSRDRNRIQGQGRNRGHILILGLAHNLGRILIRGLVRIHIRCRHLRHPHRHRIRMTGTTRGPRLR